MRSVTRLTVVALAGSSLVRLALACSKGGPPAPRVPLFQPPPPSTSASTAPPSSASASASAESASASASSSDTSCAAARPMTLHFYDVGQGLAVLVDLPDGRHVLVDTADGPRREGCGDVCAHSHSHLLERLHADLGTAPIDMLWITHQHSDHIGGAPDVLSELPVTLYVDNGRGDRKGEVRRAHEAATARGTQMRVVDPAHPDPPLRGSPNVGLVPVVPPAWPRSCEGHGERGDRGEHGERGGDENECSIALRIDYCRSSVLLTGDAEHEEEKLLEPGRATLLQVGHHGSDTSTSAALLGKVRPLYAVVSAGKRDEGLNRDYCHPRARVVQRLSRVLDADALAAGQPAAGGDASSATLTAFDGTRCDRATDAEWVAVPVSDRLWATERDGDVVLVTTGDGVFTRR